MDDLEWQLETVNSECNSASWSHNHPIWQLDWKVSDKKLKNPCWTKFICKTVVTVH